MRRFPFLFASLCVIGVGSPAMAQVERCVRTVAEFNSAWGLADDDEVLIKMAVGTYDFDGATTSGNDDDVVIRRGYNSSCSSPSDDPAATVITRGSGQGIFHGGRTGEGNVKCQVRDCRRRWTPVQCKFYRNVK